MGSRTDVASRDWVSRRTSCRIIVIICDRAVVCCRRRSLCSLFFYCSCVVPTPGIPPRFSSRSIGLWVFLVFILESRADVASRGWISRAAGLSSCVLARLVVVGAESRCTLLCDRSCAVPAPVTPPPPPPLLIAFGRFVGVSGVESRTDVASRDWISANFVPDCRLHM